MTRRRAAGLLFALPVMLGLSGASALAEDPSSTVVKSGAPPATPVTTGAVTKPQGLTEPQEQLRPSVGDDQPTGAAPPAEEITPTATDEGAGWEAAVEAAPGPTPLIGEQQAKAVQRINAYFNGITNLQGSFEQVDATNKRSTGRFYVQRPGKIRFDYAPPSGLRLALRPYQVHGYHWLRFLAQYGLNGILAGRFLLQSGLFNMQATPEACKGACSRP
jgi:hypothetical protein